MVARKNGTKTTPAAVNAVPPRPLNAVPPTAQPPRVPAPPDDESDRGVRCPDCWCAHSEVVDSRPVPGALVRRRRECRHCGRRFSTLEQAIAED